MSDDITDLLLELRAGRREALDRLVPLVYEALREMAHHRFGGKADRTLDTTSLVHEAYLRLFDQNSLKLNDRRHFFGVASIAMRQIVVDHARVRGARKRGGDLRRIDLDLSQIAIDQQADELLALDAAMRRLAYKNERLARVVEMRFFGGLEIDEVAEILGVDPRTVKRDWRKARALLLADLDGREQP